MTIEEVARKFSLGAGVFSREEVEVLLVTLIEAGVEVYEVSADNDD